jgi:hypothetical protein
MPLDLGPVTLPPITMVCGDTVQLNMAISDVNGDPVDIAGMLVNWAMGKSAQGPQLLAKVTGAGIVITDSANGMIAVTLMPSDTLGLTPANYYHEFELIDGFGNISTVARGSLQLQPGLIA